MYAFRLRAAAVALAAGVGLSACTTPYGYNGVSLGIGSGYNDPYYGAGYGYPGYGYGYGAGYPGYGYGFDPYWGWNDGFYYPGTGYYVYDSYRRKHRWTDAQRRYWQLRRQRALGISTPDNRIVIRDNWADFDRNRDGIRRVQRTDRQEPVERNVERQVGTEQSADRPVRAERTQRRVERNAAARVQRQEAREQRSSVREQRRSAIRAERATRANSRSSGAETSEQ